MSPSVLEGSKPQQQWTQTNSADDFASLIKNLWAVNMRQKKDYKVDQLIKDNSLEKS
jgi:hypothetical protein